MRERAKRITALRALRLLRDLERSGDLPSQYALAATREALADHVKAEITRRRRRRARAA